MNGENGEFGMSRGKGCPGGVSGQRTRKSRERPLMK